VAHVAQAEAGWPPDGWPAGLPRPLTALVGRGRELAEIARLVAASRLVTLVGAGGVGKTRLAIEAAAAAAAGFPGGAELIELSAVTDPALVPAVTAQRLGVEDRVSAAVTQRLIRVLRGQRRLLVLDNCEHLRAACAELAIALLGSCPGLVVLATSREPLSVPGEVAWRVPSLAFAWPGHPAAGDEPASSEAAALFLARAREARSGRAVGPAEAAAVTSICYRLDGIPLALELAAARAGALSLAEIAARLTGRMDLLSRAGTGPARHQTLRASVEWSHQLLSGPQQAVFRRLAVFAGGWTLAAAEAVCGLPPVAPDQVASVLADLADKSLVHAEQAPSGSRYRLPEVIRAFAAERLAGAGEVDDVRERHACYYIEVAGQAGAATDDLVAWVRRLDAEAENLRAVRAWCCGDQARAGPALRLAAGIYAYWLVRGSLAEGTSWLEEALAGQDGPEQARGTALGGLGLMCCIQAGAERGRDLFAASAACFRRAGDRHGEAYAWTNLSYAHALCGDIGAATQACDQALALAREAGDTWAEAAALWRSGFALALAGDTGRARATAEAGAEAFRTARDSRARAYCLMTVGDCLTREGQPAEAIAVLREALAVFEALPERWGLLRVASLLAEACAAAGDWPRAAMLLGVVDTLSERTGGQPYAFMQAGLEAVAVRGPAELGAAWAPAREAGRVLGRTDQLTAALWPARDREPPRPAGLPLTARELEVAELIGRGMTNRQIAARLFIAERTADTHVSHILAKLGCTSRAQVAAIIAAARAGR
jgi:predicted ATPase/DNA-binding CsgD family transcriptional regulator